MQLNGLMTEARNTQNRIIFTTLFQRDLCEALAFQSKEEPLTQSNYTRQRIDFLKNVDWDDPKVMDVLMKTYITRLVDAVNSRFHDMKILAKPVTVSWGSPEVGQDNRITRPSLRIMVQNEGEDHETYVLSYAPAHKEDHMGKDTRAFVKVLQEVMRMDLDICPKPVREHPIQQVHVVKYEGSQTRLDARNLYENEGKIWDIALPSREVGKKLKEIATGTRELSSMHVPPWFNSR